MKTSDIFKRLIEQRFLHTKTTDVVVTLDILRDCFGESVSVSGNIITITCTDATYSFELETCKGVSFEYVVSVNELQQDA